MHRARVQVREGTRRVPESRGRILKLEKALGVRHHGQRDLVVLDGNSRRLLLSRSPRRDRPRPATHAIDGRGLAVATFFALIFAAFSLAVVAGLCVAPGEVFVRSPYDPGAAFVFSAFDVEVFTESGSISTE